MSKPLIEKLEKNPHDEGLKLKIDDLEQLLIKAIDAYYNSDQPLFTDSTYDILETILREKNPTSTIFSKVGAPVNPEEAVKLEYYLGSMDKVKPGEKTLTRWLTKYPGNKIISEKLDGWSSLLIVNTEKLNMSLFKHGDGNYGQDISHLLKYISIGKINKSRLIEIIKSTTKKQVALRGEIIIKKEIYEQKYNQKYPKARSLISGIVNSKTYDTNTVKDMEIVFYELIYPGPKKYNDQFEIINDLGFNIVKYQCLDQIIEKELPTILINFKKDSKYEIDGIILADNTKSYDRPKKDNPEYAVAFKMVLSEQIATTTIEYVEYNISKHGILNPRIKYKPVIIGGDTHQYTTGFDAKYILDNKLGPGAEIKIIKSGDVIPYIYEIIKPAKEAQMPDETIGWHWNETGIDAVLNDIEGNEDVRTRRIINFFSVMGIKGVGPGNVERLVNAGYEDIKSILELKPDVIATIDGFKLKSATNMYTNIHSVIDKPQPLEKIMTASNIFGSGLGERKIKLVLDGISDFYNKYTKGKITKDMIMAIEGYSDKTTTMFLEGMPKFVEWLTIHDMIKIESSDMKKSDIPKGNKFNGAIIVFTGVRDTDLEKLIESQGGKVGSSISSKTTLLVAKDPNETSSKIQEANELNIPIMAYETFVKENK